MATAAVSARLIRQILGRGQASEFEGQGDLLFDGMLQFVQFRLRVNEPARHRIAQQGFALGFKSPHFGFAQRLAVMLAVAEFLSLVHQGFVLRPRLIVGDECLNARLGGLEDGMIQDDLAKLTGFVRDGGGVGQCAHAFNCLVAGPDGMSGEGNRRKIADARRNATLRPPQNPLQASAGLP